MDSPVNLRLLFPNTQVLVIFFPQYHLFSMYLVNKKFTYEFLQITKPKHWHSIATVCKEDIPSSRWSRWGNARSPCRVCSWVTYCGPEQRWSSCCCQLPIYPVWYFVCLQELITSLLQICISFIINVRRND